MYGYIYKTTNLINSKIYIGQHKSKEFDRNYYGSGVYLTRALEKYGKSNFIVEVIEYCETKESLNKREIYWIHYYKNVDNYNIASGGNGGDTITGLSKDAYESYINKISKPRTSEFKKQQSIRFMGEANPMYGKHFKMTIDRHGKNNPFYGHTHTEHTKQKISESNLGRKHTEEELIKMSNSHKGKKHSEETKQKMREARKMYWNKKKGATTIESIGNEKYITE